MDFFARQDAARRKTGLLVLYFILGVLGIIVAVYAAFIFTFSIRPWWDPSMFGIVAGCVSVVVAIGSVMKIAELSQGGRVVASMLGGTAISSSPSNPAEQRLRNVVEEMSLASGVPVPEIYVLEDRTINAFAAGHGPGDAVIGVTRGCMETLNREQLQGVIAHEFSHILNGDMLLNIRLIGVLNGILALAILGRILLQFGVTSRPSSRDEKQSGGGFAVFGLALLVIGGIGTVFCKLIKASVSRQREFLADASAVQFTRNPNGIAGALAKIKQLASNIASPHAEEASHMFFGNGLKGSWFQGFATHPPLEERIRAIAPGFDEDAALAATPPPIEEKPPSSPASPGSGSTHPWLRDIGRPSPMHVALAAGTLAALPDELQSASRELHSARSLVFALLLSDDEPTRQRQLDQLDPATRTETFRLFARRRTAQSDPRLSLIDLAIPTLRGLSPEQYRVFREEVSRLVAADGQIDVFEFALQKTLTRHLDLFFTSQTGPTIRYRNVSEVSQPARVVLSALAAVGCTDPNAVRLAFDSGARQIGAATLDFDAEWDLTKLNAALDSLAGASPDVKRNVLNAGIHTVERDGRVLPAEAELLRAVADTIDCPLPPLAEPPPLP